MDTLTRRAFVKTSCAVAAATLSASSSGVEEVNAATGAPDYDAPSQRCVINVQGSFATDYAFINHLRYGPSCFGPVGQAFTGKSDVTWPSLIDSQGYPDRVIPNAIQSWGGGCYLPDSVNYGATGSGQFYALRWKGSATIGTSRADSNTFFDVDVSRSKNYRKINSGTFSGHDPYIVFNFNGTNGGLPVLMGWVISAMGSGGTSNFPREFELYRIGKTPGSGDEGDRNAGRIFRRAYLENIAKLNPSAVRFMGAQGGNNDGQCRFENRLLPSSVGWAANWQASPVYDRTSGTNILTLPEAKPTRANPRKTPVTMQHGELVTCLVSNATVRGVGAGNGMPIANITIVDGVTLEVTTAKPHGANSGDFVQFGMWKGMVKLHYYAAAVNVIDATRFTIEVPSTEGYPAFDPSNARVWSYISLNVANRGAFPICDADGQTGVFAYGLNIGPGYRTFMFDKTISTLQDGKGNRIPGVWVTRTSQSGLPLEISTSYINELQDIYEAQGFGGPTHLWINIGAFSMLSMDPDYDKNSNWASGAAQVILSGANGYKGLHPRCKLFMEFSNELWNLAGLAFAQGRYLSARGNFHWGGSDLDVISMYTLRSTYMCEDVRSVVGSTDRVKFVLGGWANNSGAHFKNSGNAQRCLGTARFLNDPLNIWGKSVPPISHHDYFAIAPYLTVPGSYWNKKGTEGFADDAAMYNGSTPYAAPDPSRAIDNFIAQLNIGSGQAGSFYYNAQVADHAAAMQALGKRLIQYEGGPDWPLFGSVYGHAITRPESDFLIGVLNGQQWAKTWMECLKAWSSNPGFGMPAILDLVLVRWTFIPASVGLLLRHGGNNTVDAYANRIENAAFNPAFQAMCDYNKGRA